MLYKVKEVADMVGTSVRTLHHYDQIGLLKPESVTTAGYRLYADHHLERLQQILFFKELGFSLHEIKEILDSPGFDRKRALLVQKDLLLMQKDRLERIIRSVEKTLESMEGGKKLTGKEMFEPFDMSKIEEHQQKYADEVKERWGNTQAYRESQEKTSKYSKEDWDQIMAKQDEIYRNLANLVEQGPADPDVQVLVAQKRQFITDNFYNCTLEIFRGLGEMYVTDERFTATIDKYRPGLAQFVRDAISIYCDNQANAE